MFFMFCFYVKKVCYRSISCGGLWALCNWMTTLAMGRSVLTFLKGESSSTPRRLPSHATKPDFSFSPCSTCNSLHRSSRHTLVGVHHRCRLGHRRPSFLSISLSLHVFSCTQPHTGSKALQTNVVTQLWLCVAISRPSFAQINRGPPFDYCLGMPLATRRYSGPVLIGHTYIFFKILKIFNYNNKN